MCQTMKHYASISIAVLSERAGMSTEPFERQKDVVFSQTSVYRRGPKNDGAFFIRSQNPPGR